MAPMVSVTTVVANKARSVGADDWLGRLPELVASLVADWDLTVGRPHDGGTEAWVCDVVDGDGRPAVLKLCVPRPRDDDRWGHARREALVLERAQGRACAELLAADLERGALLLERLGPSLFDLGLPADRRLEILADVANRSWSPADDGPDLGLPTGKDKAAWLHSFIEEAWERLDRPCSRAAVDLAQAAGDRRGRAHDRRRSVLVHGDVHQWNTLQTLGPDDAEPVGWKLVDPDGLLAEPEYDLGVILREDPEELLADLEAGDPGRLARWLAARTGTRAEAIWEWGLVERLSTGLLAVEIGLQPVGDQMLEVAERLADWPDPIRL